MGGPQANAFTELMIEFNWSIMISLLKPGYRVSATSCMILGFLTSENNIILGKWK